MLWIYRPTELTNLVCVELLIVASYYSHAINSSKLPMLLELNMNWMHNISCLYVGQNRQYSTKALLIYDGIHYDPLLCQTDASEVTTFIVDNEQVASLALNMAREAQQVSTNTHIQC